MSLRFAFALIFLTASPAVRAESCMSDWGAASQIVRDQGLRTVEQLTRSSQQQLKGEIVRATLCREGDAYVYRLVVRDRSGQLRPVVLDAANHALGANSP